jgi:ribose transport system permease protein
VGSVLALSSVAIALLLNRGINVFLSIGVGLLLGAFLGYINSILITSRIGMPPFIATLAMMSIARGLTMVVTGGRPIYGLPESFGFIGGGYLLGIPFPVIVMILVFVVGHINLAYTIRGTHIYAVGGNPDATRLSGIDINKVKRNTYMISGLTSALAGVILASRLTSVEPLSGLGYELDAIAAAVIGGASFFGGEGSLLGTFIGALIMGVLRNGLNLLDVSTYWQQVVIGFVIAATVAIGTFRSK